MVCVRWHAITRLESSEMDERFLKNEFAYVAEKLEISESYLQSIFESTPRTYREFRNKRNLIMRGADILRLLGMEKRLFS